MAFVVVGMFQTIQLASVRSLLKKAIDQADERFTNTLVYKLAALSLGAYLPIKENLEELAQLYLQYAVVAESLEDHLMYGCRAVALQPNIQFQQHYRSPTLQGFYVTPEAEVMRGPLLPLRCTIVCPQTLLPKAQDMVVRLKQESIDVQDILDCYEENYAAAQKQEKMRLAAQIRP